MAEKTPSKLSRRKALRALAATATAAVAGVIAAPYIVRRRPKNNILFIIADALRADAVGKIVHGQHVTPALNSLAAKGASFQNAISPSSWTPISMSAILYNAQPFSVRHTPEGFQVRDAGCSLPEMLSRRGYYTLMVNANPVMNQPIITNAFADHVIFKKYHMYAPENQSRLNERCAAEINRTAFSFMDKLKRSRAFFAYVHYMDTHSPYYYPANFRRALGVNHVDNLITSNVRNKFFGKPNPLPENISIQQAVTSLRGYYDSATHYLDSELESLLAAFRNKGLLDDTLVIFTSDHGEEFADGEILEERNLGHARNLSQPVIHCPLIVHAEDDAFPKGLSIFQPTSSATAVNDLAALWVGRHKARDVARYLDACESPGKPIISYLYLSWRDFKGASYISGQAKLCARVDENGNVTEKGLFKLGGREGISPVGNSSPAMLTELQNILKLKTLEKIDVDTMNTETKQQLKALGYLN